MIKKLLFLFSGFLLLAGTAGAQITGPVSYSSLATAVSNLNAQGVGAGGAIVTITANETAPAGGYVLGSSTLNASLSATNPLVIDGGGATITSGVGTSTTLDAILKLAGTDYVTVQNFILEEPASNTTNTTQVEFGIALLKLNATAPFDGCQNVTLQNNSITLSRTNSNTRGIYTANHTATSTTLLTTGFVQAVDANNNLHIFGNTISAHHPIASNGNPAAGAQDLGMIIGGPGMGNLITGIGGTATTAAGVYVGGYDGVIISHNKILNPVTTGHTSIMYGYQTAGGVKATIMNDTVQGLVAQGTASAASMIINTAGTDTIRIANNLIENNSQAASITTGAWNGINSSATTGTIILVIDSNTIQNNTVQGTATTHTGILASSGTSLTALVTGNVISALNHNGTTTATGASGLRGFSFGTNDVTLTGNVVKDIAMGPYNTTGAITFTGYTNAGSPNRQVLSGNTFENVTITNSNTGTVNMVGISSNGIAGATSSYDFSRNVIRTLTQASAGSTASTITGISVSAASTNNVFKNRIYALSNAAAAGQVIGITAVGGNAANVDNNFISELTSAANANNAEAMIGFSYTPTTGTAPINVRHNTIVLGTPAVGIPMTSTGATFGATGLRYNTGGVVTFQNNIAFVNVDAAGATSVAALRRASGTASTAPANLGAATNGNVYFVHDPSDAAQFWYVEGIATPVNGFNNINDASFNTPCGLYKAFLGSGRESGTKEGTNVDLAADPQTGTFTVSTASVAAGNGVPTTVTDDFFGTPRSTTTPYSGAFEGTAVAGADAAAPVITYTPLANSYCQPSGIITAIITDASGVNTNAGAAPRMYYKKTTDANAFAGNTSADNGFKFVEGALTGTDQFTFTPDYSLLQSPFAPGDAIQYFIVAEDLAASPNVGINQGAFAAGFCASTVALSSSAFPLLSAPAVRQYVYIAVPTLALSASSTSLCVGGNVILTTTGAVADANTNYVTESAPMGSSTFTPGAGLTSPPDTVSLAAADNGIQYRVSLLCGTTVVATSNVVTIAVDNPTITSTTPGSRCGVGTVTLGATGSGPLILWYTAATGGSAIASGSPFTTPVISSTTDFYVSTGSGVSGSGARLVPTVTSGTYTLTAGLVFDASQSFTLNSVDVYPTAAGTVNVALTNSAGTTLQTASFPVASTGGTSPVTLALNFAVPVGTGLRLVTTSNPALVRETAPGGFPYAIGSVGSVTGGFLTASPSTSYYYFYNWQFSTGCEGLRTAVTATVTTPPAIILSASDSTLCSGEAATLTASSTNDPAYTYTYTPGALTGATQTVTPTTGTSPTTTLYTVTATDNTTGPNAGCVDTAQLVITTLPSAAPISITPPSATLACGGTPIALTVSGNLAVTDTITGTGAASTNAISTPYRGSQGAHKVQMLYSAAELTELGMIAGSRIDSIGHEITAFTAPDTFVNFTISLKNTAGTTLASAFESGTQQVFSNAALILATAGAQRVVHGLTTPFTWDGTSNLLVETCFNNQTTVAGQNATVRTTTTTGGARYASTLVLTPGFCGTLPTGTSSTARPNLIIAFTNRSALTPTAGLFTDAAATVPYTGGITNPVIYARPSSSTTYVAGTTAPGGCTQQASSVITVTGTPTALANNSGAADTARSTQNATTVTLRNADCELLATVTQSGAAQVSGNMTTEVFIDGSVQTANTQPYVQRHYEVNPDSNATAATATVTLYATQAEFDAYNVVAGPLGYPALPSGVDNGNVRVTKFSGTSATGAPLTYSPGVATLITPTVTWNSTNSWWEISFPVTGFSGFFIHSGSIGPLNLQSLDIAAANRGSVNDVRWTAAGEKGGTRYELQRSADGRDFATIASVSGTGEQPATYAYTDDAPFEGLNYYRVRAEGTGSATVLSKTVTAYVSVSSGNGFALQAFPNPVSENGAELILRALGTVTGTADVTLMDATGKTLRRARLSGSEAHFDISSLPAGTYLLRYTDGARTEVLKVTKR